MLRNAKWYIGQEMNQQKPNIEVPKESLINIRNYLKDFFKDVIDLKHGVVKSETIKEIRDKMTINGANAWMLMCSIMIASLGLNMDSQAVIIGAMLISPLMSPILGIGLSVGINDKEMLKKALIHFGIAIGIAIITSTIYFYLSPFNETGPEIQSRTQPTFLDVIIAFFGGIAGIISIARKDISTTIPGVAIATALMPPLCVTGFGIANGNWGIASSSFYLFFLNTFFVSLATYIIVRYLGFPYKQYVSIQARRKGRMYVFLFALLVIIPSFFIFTKVFKEYKTRIKIDEFIDNYIGKDKIYLDDYVIINENPKRLILKVYGDKINKSSIDNYQEGLKKSGVNDTKIEIITTSEIKLEQLKKLESKISGVQNIAERLSVVEEEKKKKSQDIILLEEKLKSFQLDSMLFQSLSLELKGLFPDLENYYFGKMQYSNFYSSTNEIPVVSLDWKSSKSKSLRNSDEVKIKKFLIQRLSLDTLVISN